MQCIRVDYSPQLGANKLDTKKGLPGLANAPAFKGSTNGKTRVMDNGCNYNHDTRVSASLGFIFSGLLQVRTYTLLHTVCRHIANCTHCHNVYCLLPHG